MLNILSILSPQISNPTVISIGSEICDSEQN